MGAALALGIEPNRPSLIAALHRLQRFIDGEQLAERPAYVIALVAEEVLTNAAKYAGGTWAIALEVTRDAGAVTLRFADTGPPFDPTRPREPSSPDASGGRGVALVQRMANGLEYRREGDRNVLVVTVHTSP